ncbi:MAG TPA: hypothetical protein VM328_01055 [Fimbriimonadaceae bacterium]|nr:hypothetical protein [Fimbriimonadaceae bacterium]
MKPGSSLIVFGVLLAAGPMAVAMLAEAINPSQGSDGGWVPVGFFSTLIFAPLGLIAVVIGLVIRSRA